MPIEIQPFLIAAAIIAAAYFVFGISGFGSGLVAVPVLTHLWPVQFVLPLMVLLDAAASLTVGMRGRRHTDFREVSRVVPATIIGLAAGVTLLVELPPKVSMATLGAGVILFGFWSVVRRGPAKPIHAGWVWPAGFVSGVASGLIGVGGPPVAVYLSARLSDKSVLRATLATMLFISVATRIVMFLGVGLLDARHLLIAALLIPFAFGGLTLGSRVHLKLSREHFARFVAALVCVAGISLIVRAIET